MKVSAPPHTDKQDVFVVQTQGAKHWRVFKPPSPSQKMNRDPYARGKGPDALTLDELAPIFTSTLIMPFLFVLIAYSSEAETLTFEIFVLIPGTAPD